MTPRVDRDSKESATPDNLTPVDGLCGRRVVEQSWRKKGTQRESSHAKILPEAVRILAASLSFSWRGPLVVSPFVRHAAFLARVYVYRGGGR